jgi:hypothetical protein
MFKWKQIDDNSVVSIGVLNDFDMAVDLQSESGPSSLERTGTLPYMALDLLLRPDGTVKHLYRHDAESFVWVLLDLASSYSGGRRKTNYHMKDWFGVNKPSMMYAQKFAVLMTPLLQQEFMDAISDANLLDVVEKLLCELKKIVNKAVDQCVPS